MNKKIAKTISLIAAAAMLSAPLGGCSKKPSDNNTSSSLVQDESTVKSTLAFKPTYVDAPQGYQISYNVNYHDGLYYSSYDQNNDDGSSVKKIIAFDETGLKKEYTVEEVSAEEWGGIRGNVSFDDAGTMYCLFSKTSYSDDGSGSDTYILYKFAPSGEVSEKLDLSALLSDISSDMVYLSDITFDNSGNMVLTLSDRLMITDPSGKMLFDIKSDNENGYISSVIKTNTGTLAYMYSEYGNGQSKVTLTEIDIANKGKG
ncbi:MAG: hypothetical protein IKR73_06200, partial [Oscillospiraceae bacterium]|nr:hypothetical protein [Oscillospiraceae bacterium]